MLPITFPVPLERTERLEVVPPWIASPTLPKSFKKEVSNPAVIPSENSSMSSPTLAYLAGSGQKPPDMKATSQADAFGHSGDATQRDVMFGDFIVGGNKGDLMNTALIVTAAVVAFALIARRRK